MKRMTLMLTLAITFAATQLFAISGSPLRVEIPFDFAVGKTVMKAGTYELTDGINKMTLRLRTEDLTEHAMFFVQGGRPVSENGSKLQFRVIDGKHFLVSMTHLNQQRDVSTLLPEGKGFLASIAAVPMQR